MLFETLSHKIISHKIKLYIMLPKIKILTVAMKLMCHLWHSQTDDQEYDYFEKIFLFCQILLSNGSLKEYEYFE